MDSVLRLKYEDYDIYGDMMQLKLMLQLRYKKQGKTPKEIETAIKKQTNIFVIVLKTLPAIIRYDYCLEYPEKRKVIKLIHERVKKQLKQELKTVIERNSPEEIQMDLKRYFQKVVTLYVKGLTNTKHTRVF
jgi:archaellum biogenesis ATPase FlaH